LGESDGHKFCIEELMAIFLGLIKADEVLGVRTQSHPIPTNEGIEQVQENENGTIDKLPVQVRIIVHRICGDLYRPPA
jgi:hypothetical protein